mmetsp:Transcript_52298/g.151999  ORF Transcript_52298/g.151999 Transcript_52298/m.151999 type:complete len:238 (+) Transcript_52298:3-716(+)
MLPHINAQKRTSWALLPPPSPAPSFPPRPTGGKRGAFQGLCSMGRRSHQTSKETVTETVGKRPWNWEMTPVQETHGVWFTCSHSSPRAASSRSGKRCARRKMRAESCISAWRSACVARCCTRSLNMWMGVSAFSHCRLLCMPSFPGERRRAGPTEILYVDTTVIRAVSGFSPQLSMSHQLPRLWTARAGSTSCPPRRPSRPRARRLPPAQVARSLTPASSALGVGKASPRRLRSPAS